MVLQLFSALLLIFHNWWGGTIVPVDRVPVEWVTTTGVVAHIVDGDTIDVRLADVTTVRVRYIGIDTPEVQPQPECGNASATARNRDLVFGKTVTLVPGPGPYDTYGRRLAYVYVGDIFINQTLLKEGWAELMMIPPNTAYRPDFEILQTTARTQRAGIWSCSGR